MAEKVIGTGWMRLEDPKSLRHHYDGTPIYRTRREARDRAFAYETIVKVQIVAVGLSDKASAGSGGDE